jgi:hypothetical protein
VILPGCGERGAREALERADAVLDEIPDSAMAIIAGIDTATLNTERLRADYSLMRTMALLKTDPSAATEEGLKAAYDYYGNSDKPSRQTMLTHYMKGSFALWTQDYKVSFSEYDKAMAFARECGDSLYLGMSALNVGTLYALHYQSEEEDSVTDIGMECLLKEENPALRVFALHCKGMSLIHNDRPYEADSFLLEAKEGAEALGDTASVGAITQSMAYGASFCGRYEEAISTLEMIRVSDPGRLGYNDYEALIRSYAGVGDIVRARSYFDVLPRPVTDNEKVSWWSCAKRIFRGEGNYEKSLAASDSAAYYERRITQNKLSSNLSEMRDIRVADESAGYKEEAESGNKNGQLAWITLGLALIVGGAGVGRLVKLVRRQGKKMEEEMRRRDADNEALRERNIDLMGECRLLLDEKERMEKELQDAGEKAGAERAAMEGRIASVENELAEVRKRMLENFRAQHEGVARLCNKGITKIEIAKRPAIKALRQEYISVYSDSSFYANMEECFDFITGGLMSEMKASGRLTDVEARIVVYSGCGFSYRSVADILGMKDKTVSAYKTRIRRMLEGEEGLSDRVLGNFNI